MPMTNRPQRRPMGVTQGQQAERSYRDVRQQTDSPYRDVPEAQRLLREGTVAQAELMRPELLGRIGDTLGGLNQIGALRSGGTAVALRDLNRDFTDRIGLFASRSTMGALESGLGAQRIRNEQEQIAAQRRSALLSAIGNVVGAGIGFAIGGPPGALAGAQVGGSVGGGGGGGGRTPLTDRNIFQGQRFGGQFG